LKNAQDGLSSRIEYNTDLFQKDTIIRMVGHFQTLLVSIVTNQTQSITELSILTEAEQHQLIEWNNTTKDYPKDKTIVDFFEQQVENTPTMLL
jgi:non-ribosomal peptide synthetase component F